jgi:hypothetical protein
MEATGLAKCRSLLFYASIRDVSRQGLLDFVKVYRAANDGSPAGKRISRKLYSGYRSYFELINNNPKAITTNQNLYTEMDGMMTHPICMTTASRTRTTASTLRIDRALLLIGFCVSLNVLLKRSSCYIVTRQ